jgi:uncharacterized protein (DUF1499 family)
MSLALISRQVARSALKSHFCANRIDSLQITLSRSSAVILDRETAMMLQCTLQVPRRRLERKRERILRTTHW